MNRGEFAREVFKRINVEANGKTLTFAQAWMAYEATRATNNPFATTQPWTNSTEFNSVGVRNYATVEDGIAATVATLENGYYNHLMFVLRHPNSTPKEMMGALNASPWGSYVYPELYEDVEHNYNEYNVVVPGSDGVVAPTLIPTTDESETTQESTEPVSEPTTTTVVPTNESEPTVDNETPTEETAPTEEVDTLESRLAKMQADQVTAPVENTVAPENFTA